MNAILLVDKPAGITSHGVVAKVRRWAGTRKVGHAGTLDPMATGLLVLGLDRGTKLLTYLVGADKTYTATIRLGVGTLTDDAEGEVTETPGYPAPGVGVDDLGPVEADPALGRPSVVVPVPAEVTAAIATLTGEIEQVPSAVSAIKVDGKRSYARVRAGEEVTLTARRVRVGRFEVLAARAVLVEVGGVAEAGEGLDAALAPRAVRGLDLDVVVDCSSGTYIRALARDLGRALGSAGHLTALRRTKVGPFEVAAATTLERLEGDQTPETRAEVPRITLAEAARAVMVTRTVSPDDAARLCHGQMIAATGHDGPVAALDEAGRLVAIIEDHGPRARSSLVIAVPVGP